MFLTKGTTDRHVYDRLNFFCRTTLTLRTLSKISSRICSLWRVLKYWGLCVSELSQENKGCGEGWSSHWFFCSQWADEILYEHPYSIHETSRYLPKIISYRHSTSTQIRPSRMQSFSKVLRGSFRQWDKSDYDLAVTMLQNPHVLGGYGMTPNTIAQTSAKVDMSSHFLGLVGSLPPDEQKSLVPKSSGTRPRYVDHTSSSPAHKGIWYPLRLNTDAPWGNVHGARPSCSPLWYSPIPDSQMSLQVQCTYSWGTSTWGFSTGSVTVSTHLV